MKRNMVQTDQYRMKGDLFVLDKPFMNEDGKPVIYPFGFEPTLHIYRYGTLDKLKQGQNIFVGAMADIFGEWIPDSWIDDILGICEKHPQHNYLFLTKNPERYTQYGVPYGKENMWYGTTITCDTDADRFNYLPAFCNTFVSIEPLMSDIATEHNVMFRQVNWIIIGAETGHRKEKVIPEFEWIKRIVVEADYNGIPVFMKDSLIPIVGEKNMRRDYPKELQIRKRSEKVNKKLSGNCMLCGKTEDKNKMVTERYSCLGYSDDHGTETEDVTRESDQSTVELSLERTIQEALMVNPRTSSVEEFSFEWGTGRVKVSFIVYSVDGEPFTVDSIIEV